MLTTKNSPVINSRIDSEIDFRLDFEDGYLKIVGKRPQDTR
jgi:hypothetical protein